MKKKIEKVISFILCVVMVFAVSVTAFAAETEDYTINSPYSHVVWGETKEYKGNLHTHSTISDSKQTMLETLTEMYNQGFDFVAMTEHGITGKAWNEKPYLWALYSYQGITGKERSWLTDEEYIGMTTGTYPLADGTERGYGMTCVTGGNELNGLTASKSHVNGFFLPENSCNGNVGFENGYEYAVNLADSLGGYSQLNHLGDWLCSNKNINAVYNEESLELFKNIFLKYDSCLGMEIFNEKNATTPYDRILWDNLLMKTLPYARNIIAFSNSDTHELKTIDSSFSVFLMEENNVENIKATMQSGSFFAITRVMRENDVIGPSEGFNYMDQKLPYPMFNELVVDGHTVTVKARNTNYIQWIANGKVIDKKNINSADEEIVLDLDKIDGSEDFLYIRAELYGDGGLCASQALTIDNGKEPLKYEEDKSFGASFLKFINFLKSLRVYVFAQEIVRAIKG